MPSASHASQTQSQRRTHRGPNMSREKSDAILQLVAEQLRIEDINPVRVIAAAQSSRTHINWDDIARQCGITKQLARKHFNEVIKPRYEKSGAALDPNDRIEFVQFITGLLMSRKYPSSEVLSSFRPTSGRVYSRVIIRRAFHNLKKSRQIQDCCKTLGYDFNKIREDLGRLPAPGRIKPVSSTPCLETALDHVTSSVDLGEGDTRTPTDLSYPLHSPLDGYSSTQSYPGMRYLDTQTMLSRDLTYYSHGGYGVPYYTFSHESHGPDSFPTCQVFPPGYFTHNTVGWAAPSYPSLLRPAPPGALPSCPGVQSPSQEKKLDNLHSLHGSGGASPRDLIGVLGESVSAGDHNSQSDSSPATGCMKPASVDSAQSSDYASSKSGMLATSQSAPLLSGRWERDGDFELEADHDRNRISQAPFHSLFGMDQTYLLPVGAYSMECSTAAYPNPDYTRAQFAAAMLRGNAADPLQGPQGGYAQYYAPEPYAGDDTLDMPSRPSRLTFPDPDHSIRSESDPIHTERVGAYTPYLAGAHDSSVF
ncbi:hypothetical protein GMRT_13328 [Giardia muris]|uniref:Uncharacterized protein n=1 Tax=Giardia muris TaxID=5742 RepID=A0A4Z1SKX7_GIAMU|nr:hypothetical protein GMRT_13328 [Giardia muris]|eukprot:TNJ26292.1 hypothetical protein GMRT_13328 [Giardia muris]